MSTDKPEHSTAPPEPQNEPTAPDSPAGEVSAAAETPQQESLVARPALRVVMVNSGASTHPTG